MGTAFKTATLWADTTAHFFPSSPGGTTDRCTVEYTSLDSSGILYKRCAERSTTHYTYRHGFYLLSNTNIMGGFAVMGYFGAYHGYNNTRANFGFSIAPTNQFDTTSAYSVGLDLGWSLSSLGIANGGVGYLSGRVLLTDPPSYTFSPADPGVGYKNMTALRQSVVHVLFGYSDIWSANHSQWAAARADNTYVLFQATENPKVEVLEELSVGPDRVYIARWDGETRLWIKRGDGGLIVPLGKEVAVRSRAVRRRVSAKEVEPIEDRPLGDGLVLELETDFWSRDKQSRRWLLYILYDDERDEYNVAFGDSAWQGSKIGFFLHSFKP